MQVSADEQPPLTAQICVAACSGIWVRTGICPPSLFRPRFRGRVLVHQHQRHPISLDMADSGIDLNKIPCGTITCQELVNDLYAIYYTKLVNSE